MGDSSCLLHGSLAIPNESKQVNPILSDSISFGRFMTEPVSCEIWCSKNYVDEAEMYVKPGSVAEKKAFFEAHYKRITTAKTDIVKTEADEEEEDINNKDEIELDDVVEDCGVKCDNQLTTHSLVEITETDEEDINNKDEIEDDVVEGCGVKRDKQLSTANSVEITEIEMPSTTASRPLTAFRKENNVGIQRSARKSLRELIDSVLIKEPDKEPFFATSLRTPNEGTTKGVSKIPLATPLAENTSNSKLVSAYRNKLKSTPFILRTEERAAKRKQEKPGNELSCTLCFKARPLPEFYKERKNSLKKGTAKGVSKVHVATTLTENTRPNAPSLFATFTLRTQERAAKRKQEKAANQLQRLSCTFGFKARPLPDFYKERENSVKKVTPVPPPQTVLLGRSNSSKKQDTTSMLPPPPPLRTSTSMPPLKTSKCLLQRKIISGSKAVTPLLRVAPKNMSPNI